MEVQGSENNRYIVFLYEAIGTALMIVALNFGMGNRLVPATMGFTLFITTVFFGPLSGGHFNPAVTLGVLIHEVKQNSAYNITYAILIFTA